ncbi:hypothetical protein IQ62_13595 [Streptomyces scabiei]|nr:hypothetical protein IQ62_13595 [Streptomyces scabiei]
MRRDRDAENGLMEFMVIELLVIELLVIELLVIESLRRAGEIRITQVSLNFTVFRSVFERGGRIAVAPARAEGSRRRRDCPSDCTAGTGNRADEVARTRGTR